MSDAAALPKAGNRAARRLLIEAAWSYRFPARLSRELLLRQELSGSTFPAAVSDWHAQKSLSQQRDRWPFSSQKRWRHRSARRRQ